MRLRSNMGYLSGQNSNLPKCNTEEGRGGEAKTQHKTHTEHYSKLPVYFTSVLYIPLLVHLSPDFFLPISLH